MSHSLAFRRFTKISLILWLLAFTQSVLALCGIWTITSGATERLLFAIFESFTMLAALYIALLIRRYVISQSKSRFTKNISHFSFGALVLCFGGDLINRNFFQSFYQYDDVIKHSYLVDSIYLFFPGYLLLLVAVTKTVLARGVNALFLLLSSILTAVISLVIFNDLVNANSAGYLVMLTGVYALLISIVGLSGVWLLKAYGWRHAPKQVWAVFLGLLLAMIADAVIGNFWLYGNNGAGYFPLVSHVNWIIYIASQLLVIQLPLIVLNQPTTTTVKA
jgi:hypothetical protein